MPKRSIAPLSESPGLRYVTFILLYFSQGIPEGITIFAIPAWLAMNGKPAPAIAAYSAVIIIPFSLKILLAPLMERYTYLPMGRRKPWLLFGQFGIFCSLIALSFIPNPLNNIAMITAVAVCVHVFVIFQDIATDSLVIDIVPLEQQGRANSFMWGSKTIGTSVSLLLGSLLINRYGLPAAVLVMASAILFIMLVPMLLRERSGEKLVPWSAGSTSPDAASLVVDSWGKLFRSFKQVVLLRNTLLLLTLVFITMAGLHFMRTLLPIFTIQELGWNNIRYSQVYSTSTLAGGITGMAVGAIVIQRYGIVRLLQAGLVLVFLLVLFVAGSRPLWGSSIFISGFIATFCTLLTLINIAVLALAMHFCWKRISAMQFTFCMTIFNAGLMTGAAVLGYLRPLMSWQMLFIFFTTVIAVAFVLLTFLKTAKHREQVERLEQAYQERLSRDSVIMAGPASEPAACSQL